VGPTASRSASSLVKHLYENIELENIQIMTRNCVGTEYFLGKPGKITAELPNMSNVDMLTYETFGIFNFINSSNWPLPHKSQSKGWQAGARFALRISDDTGYSARPSFLLFHP
jgi:hypothetical protein